MTKLEERLLEEYVEWFEKMREDKKMTYDCFLEMVSDEELANMMDEDDEWDSDKCSEAQRRLELTEEECEKTSGEELIEMLRR